MSRDQRSDAEEAFFGDYEVDPELVALAEAPNPWTPLLLLLVAIVAAYLGAQYLGDARYALQSSSRYTTLGDVEFWGTSNDRFVDGQLVLPSNRYVHIEGVSQRRAALGGLGYTKLVGVPVFAEVSRELLNDPSRSSTVGDYLAVGGDRHTVGLPGRLVPFDQLPRRYEGITRYLAKAFEMNLCGVEGDPDLLRALRAERDRQILGLNERLGRVASRAEIAREIGPECERAWLYQEGRAPKDHRGYLYIFVFLGLVSALSVGLAIRWMVVFRVWERD